MILGLGRVPQYVKDDIVIHMSEVSGSRTDLDQEDEAKDTVLVCDTESEKEEAESEEKDNDNEGKDPTFIEMLKEFVDDLEKKAVVKIHN